MNKKYFVVLSTAVLVSMGFVACSEKGTEDFAVEPTPDSTPKSITMTFEASQEGSGNLESKTRTGFSGGESTGTDHSVVWLENDKIRVYPDIDSNNKSVLSLDNEYAGQAYGKFTGDVAADKEFFSSMYPNQNYAYVSTPATNMDDAIIYNVSVPTVQTATENSFDPSVGILMGTTKKEDAKFLFTNLCSYLRIVPKYDCNSITITANNGEVLSGSVNMRYAKAADVSAENGSRFDEDKPMYETYTINGVQSAVNKVILKGNMTEGKTYYIAVLPQVLSQGFSVNIEDCGSVITRTISSNVKLRRDEYYDITSVYTYSKSNSTVPKSVDFVDLGIVVDSKTVLWATHNLGAVNPTDAGSYYAWGEIATLGQSDESNNVLRGYNMTQYTSSKTTVNYSTIKTNFCDASYKWGDGSEKSYYNTWYMKKYATSYPDLSDPNNPTVKAGDALTELENADDAACATLNCSDARMPTKAEFEALLANCYWVYTTEYNGVHVSGFIVYKAQKDDDKGKEYDGSKCRKLSDYSEATGYTPSTYSITSNAHIFLPFAGFHNGTSGYQNGDTGYYWSRTLDNTDEGGYCLYAYDLLLRKSGSEYYYPSVHYDLRRGGQCIRPVKTK